MYIRTNIHPPADLYAMLIALALAEGKSIANICRRRNSMMSFCKRWPGRLGVPMQRLGNKSPIWIQIPINMKQNSAYLSLSLSLSLLRRHAYVSRPICDCGLRTRIISATFFSLSKARWTFEWRIHLIVMILGLLMYFATRVDIPTWRPASCFR